MAIAGMILPTLQDGYRSQAAGDLERAERLYRQALDIEPDNVRALNLLGALFARAGRFDEAVATLTRAVTIGSEFAATHGYLARSYLALQQPAQAAEHFRHAARLNPGDPVVLGELAHALRVIGQPEQAIVAYEAALKLRADSAEYWSGLAAAHNDAYSFEHGLQAIDCALKLEPRMPQAWSIKGNLMFSSARYPEAIECYCRSLDLDPQHMPALVGLAWAQHDSDDPQAALATIRRALDIAPEDAHALFLMGVVRKHLGEPETAAECFRAVIRVAPGMAAAHHELAQIAGRRGTDEDLAAMAELWGREDVAPNARISLAQGLYHALEARSEYERAFRFLATGNQSMAERYPYDDDKVARRMDASVTATEIAIARNGPEAGEPDPRPVFVFGMPRSGTSLTEQILASHSQVAGAGELIYSHDAISRIGELTQQAFPQGLTLLSGEQFRELGRYYMSRHSPANLACRFVVDKTPGNYQNIGFLALALPQARFIHCHRDPVANCFAIYRMPFDARHTYAHDQAALGRHYTRYWMLMRRWRDLFPGRILDVCYEDTVADVEWQSRRMLEFLGLPFEENVLRYYETERLVRTPSANQVRQPIYRDSLDSWKNYERHLGPLIESLQPVLRGIE
jgi:tetratricopeptide (TPR) repeat protein